MRLVKFLTANGDVVWINPEHVLAVTSRDVHGRPVTVVVLPTGEVELATMDAQTVVYAFTGPDA